MREARIAVIVGTRPEVIKMAPVFRALQATAGLVPVLCIAGQHVALMEQALADFSLVPDVRLPPIGDAGLAARLGALTAQLGAALEHLRPALTLVQGDTATALAGSFAAFAAPCPVGHVEAGLRTGDLAAPWPEEGHRRAIAAIAALHFAPTARARDNLLREGVAAERIHLTGNTGIDALRATAAMPPALPDALDQALQRAHSAGRRLLLVTGHRRENFGAGLAGICAALAMLATRPDVLILYPVHRNPQVDGPVRRALDGLGNVILAPPLDYRAFVQLLERCHIVLTDSGGVQEEAPAFGKPVLVLRETTERPEAVDAGVARLVGTNPVRIVAETVRLLDDRSAYAAMARAVSPFGDGQAAARIAAIAAAYLQDAGSLAMGGQGGSGSF